MRTDCEIVAPVYSCWQAEAREDGFRVMASSSAVRMLSLRPLR
jgi:hypothetical protein